MSTRYAYCIGPEMTDVTRKWLLPHMSYISRGDHGYDSIRLQNGLEGVRDDWFVYDDGEITLVKSGEYAAKHDAERCVRCRFAVPCAHDATLPICLADGCPDVWRDACTAVVDNPNNRFDTYFTPKDPALEQLELQAEWDMDYYAKEILGKTNEDIDAQGDEDCIHAWVTKDLLRRQKLIYEAKLARAYTVAENAVNRFSKIGATLHAANIDAETKMLRDELEGLLS